MTVEVSRSGARPWLPVGGWRRNLLTSRARRGRNFHPGGKGLPKPDDSGQSCVGTTRARPLCVALSSVRYEPRSPARNVLYQVVQEHFETFREEAARLRDGEGLPRFVGQEFRDFLRCGWLAGGFARFRRAACDCDQLVAFSCKGRGFCPSCGGRRMAERAAHLVDRVFPDVPVRQWVLSLLYRLRGSSGSVAIGGGAASDAGGWPQAGPADPDTTWADMPEAARDQCWAALMQRTYGIDVLACPRCGGSLRLITLIEDASVIGRILAHLGASTEIPAPRPRSGHPERQSKGAARPARSPPIETDGPAAARWAEHPPVFDAPF